MIVSDLVDCMKSKW